MSRRGTVLEVGRGVVWGLGVGVGVWETESIVAAGRLGRGGKGEKGGVEKERFERSREYLMVVE